MITVEYFKNQEELLNYEIKRALAINKAKLKSNVIRICNGYIMTEVTVIYKKQVIKKIYTLPNKAKVNIYIDLFETIKKKIGLY